MTMARRVLHVTSGMDRGGIETWIMNVMRCLNPARLRFEFFVEATTERAYDAEILECGGRIHRSPPFRYRVRTARALARVLSHGHYDVVHVHGRHDAVWAIATARLLGVPTRIAHVHNVKDSHERTVLQRSYKRAAKSLLWRNATWILGCSHDALASLYPADRIARCEMLQVLPYYVDTDRFVRTESRSGVLAEFSLPSDTKLLGHVGRFVWEKNHAFLVEAFQVLYARDSRWRLLLIGDGPLVQEIRTKLAQCGVSDAAIFAGLRSDVPRLMSSMDVLAFPSLLEGFGLVAVEAQAVGVPCALSATIPRAVEVVPQMCTRMPADATPDQWCEAIAALAAVEFDRQAAWDTVAASVFNRSQSVGRLLGEFYGFSDPGALVRVGDGVHGTVS